MTNGRHYEVTTSLNTSAENAFRYLDDPKRLSSHMSKSSWRMAGSKMEIRTDDKGGQQVGSEIILSGKMMGIPLFVRETIVKRIPLQTKIWKTVGPQKMLILDQYTMGFELIPNGKTTTLKVFIDYQLPPSGLGRFLGLLFAKTYAKWCTQMMATDAAAQLFKSNNRIYGVKQ